MLRRISGDGGQAAESGPSSRETDEDAGEPLWETADQSVHRQSMASLIADEIIPRLIAAHRTPLPGSDGDSAWPTASASQPLDAVQMADLSVLGDAQQLSERVQQALASGLSWDSLLLEVMAPAARLLGARWEDDSADFVDVTLGLWRMQEVLHELASRQHGAAAATRLRRSILCAVAPGDDHSFGSLVLEDIFGRAGWITGAARGADRDGLMGEAARQHYDIIALTVSVERNSAVLRQLVADLRNASRNPGVSIMIGGSVFNAVPELADEVGADATASDGRAALHRAELLVARLVVGRSAEGLPRRHGARQRSAGAIPG